MTNPTSNNTRPRRRPGRSIIIIIGSSSCLPLVLLLVALLTVGSLAFVPATYRSTSSRSSPLCALKRLDGETEKAYFKRITAAASDPAAFERLVSGGDSKKKHAVTPLHASASNNSTNGEEPSVPKKGYVRVEEWEAEQQKRKLSGDLTWEERVQFEGQRSGDRFKQNEILRHNLNAW